MTRDYLLGLLSYHYWSRDRLLAAVAALTPGQYAEARGSSFASVRDTLNHLYLAEWIWLRRLHGESPAAAPAIDYPDLAVLQHA